MGESGANAGGGSNLSRAGAPEVGSQRFMPSDTDYLSAVQQGDTAAAQRMVGQAAKAAGYLDASELSGPKYNEGDPVYHNTPSKFTVFEPGKNGLIQFTPSKTLFGKRGDIKVAAYLKEPVIRNSTGLILSVKDPSQVKLAEPITRDDQGNVIPLSQRFQTSSADIRFMPSPDSSMPGAYSFTGGYRALPGKSKGSLRIYSPAGSLIGIAASLDEAQRIIRKKAKQ